MRTKSQFFVSIPLVLLAIACGSGSSSTSKVDGGGGTSSGTGGMGGEKSGSGGDVSNAGAGGENPDVTPNDDAPGKVENIDLEIDGDQYTFSWDLPDDDDLADLRLLVLKASEDAPEFDDAESLDLEKDSVLLANFVSGTDYVAYFFLADEGGNQSLTKFEFTSAGSPPISDLFVLPIDNGFFMRWTNPAEAFETVAIRQDLDTPPPDVESGEEAFNALASRALITSLNNDSTYGFSLYTVNAADEVSDFTQVTAQPNPDHAVVVDASAECDSYGYRIGETPWVQTFTRGDAGEDVLTGIELEISRKGEPTDKLGIRILDENDEYLWSNNIQAADIPAGTNWILVSANGKGVTNVPYDLLEPGKEYKIELRVSQSGGSETDYFTWKSSLKDSNCYEGGEASVGGGRDFHFRTIHATADE